MSRREALAVLVDARDAIVFLRDQIAGIALDDFVRDGLRVAATERKLEILGEALSRLGRIDRAAFDRVPDAARAIATRNIIAHGYDIVDPAILWDTVRNDLPAMLAVIETMIPPEDAE